MKAQRQGGFLMAKIHQASGRLFARILKDNRIRLSPPQGRIMFVLWREGAVPIREIARQTSLGKSTLTSMLDRLERNGYLRRVRSRVDRRAILIEPTARDRDSQEVFIKASREMTEVFYAGFTSAEIDRFERDLTRIFANLRDLHATNERSNRAVGSWSRPSSTPGHAWGKKRGMGSSTRKGEES